jgi:hypothetical protein
VGEEEKKKERVKNGERGREREKDRERGGSERECV